ncbi:HhH-GPD [Oceaniovalibus guishaninsula JLT2003]|uniref:DNA-3-methyladenine glycosylase II n=1 Tax=Oceaniovalibus guishaninsula JLT2003 TaxID=1231392 RepID=K2GR06_9RHOB|nr:DNA-3-methyladenine glycosylase [Oceaniovalibus guishaninsula]EKE45041.1 HhH-GPD [Oceaniovalibus guishaninsula JLT2003]
MDERIITGEACIAEGADWLVRVEPRFGPVLAATGPWPLRLRPGGYPALVDAIVSQQVSVAAAAAIAARVREAGFHDPAIARLADDDALRACGLSRPKARYVKALAGAGIDFDALDRAPTDEVIARLVAVPGIGVWTAEIYALFSLGRADAFPAGDLALQEAARLLFDLPDRPRDRALRQLAEGWRPWRGVAARALWAYYRVAKDREGTL